MLGIWILSQKYYPYYNMQNFEDNSGALKIAKMHKFRPCTKHVNVKRYHFCDYIVKGNIIIKLISTFYQLADFLTKLVNEETMKRLRKRVLE